MLVFLTLTAIVSAFIWSLDKNFYFLFGLLLSFIPPIGAVVLHARYGVEFDERMFCVVILLIALGCYLTFQYLQGRGSKSTG